MKFLSQFKTWTHVLAGAVVTGVTLYVSNDAIRGAVNGLLGAKGAAILGGLATIILAYANPNK